MASEITYNGGVSGLEASNTQDAIDELATRTGGADIDTLKDIYFGSIEERQLLANAINNKGITTDVTDSLSQMAENIDNILTEVPYYVKYLVVQWLWGSVLQTQGAWV